MGKHLTPPKVAAMYGIKPDKVLVWIRSGELQAVNIATKPSGRPRFVVSEADLAAFEARRSAIPTPKPARRTKAKAGTATEYF